MGNPLAPTLANFFLAHIESVLFSSIKKSYPEFYVRYVDDIFCVFRDGVDWMKFFDNINALHQSRTFTFEEPHRQMIPFLDVHVKLTDNSIDTCVFRKPMYTEVMLNFYAMAPTKWKSGLILCLLNRAHRICSSLELFKVELQKLKILFIKNAYPEFFFEKIYKRFLEKIHNQIPNTEIGEENLHKFNLNIPYIGKPSVKFGQKLAATISNKFGVEINTVYTTTKVGSIFRLKSRTPRPLMSCVVYEFRCLGDQATTYVGMTERNMALRVAEHGRNSSKTAVALHIAACPACKKNKLSTDDFYILKKCRDAKETKIHEALEIMKRNPTLNKQMFKNQGASFVLNIFG